jgi:hypothetical protein
MSEDRAELTVEHLSVTGVPHNGSPAADSDFPREAFPCPHCGQMLGPAVRVCVACRQAIDPGQIQEPAVVPLAAVPERTKPRNTPFPWTMLLVGLVGLMLLIGAAEAKFGPTLTMRYLMRYGQVIPFATALWVVLDAYRKGVPRPVQWGLATILLWPIAFPWYLARRRQLDTVCPFVESGFGSLLRIVLLWLLINILFLIFFGSMLKSLPK